MDPRKPYRPIGDNPDPQDTPQSVDPNDNAPEPSDPAPDGTDPAPRSADDDPAHDASAAPDD
jgi:hypothetical protein